MPRTKTYLNVANCFIAAFILVAAATQLSAQTATEPEAGAPVATTPTDEAPQEIKDAAEAFQKQDFAKALELLEKAAANDADLPPAQIMMAQFYGRVGQGGAIRASLERAVIDAPEDPEAYVLLADFALNDSRVTEANLLYEKAKTLLAKFDKSKKRKDILEPRVLGGLAAVAEARGDWAAAQKNIEAWLAIDKDSTAAMQRLARAKFKLKDANGALEMLKKAYEVDKENVLTPGATLATYYEQAGDRDAAKQWMDYALKVAPTDLRTHLVAASWALETEQLDRAEELAAKATKLDPESFQAKVLCGSVALMKEDFKEAELYFESAYLQEPGSSAARNGLALALCEQTDEKKKRQALQHAQANVQAYPRSREAASTFAWTLYMAGEKAQAEQVLGQVMKGGPFSADTAYYAAKILVDQGKKDGAKQLLEGALKSKRPFSKRERAKKLYESLK